MAHLPEYVLERIYKSSEIDIYIENLHIKEKINLNSKSEFDDEYLFTNGDKWDCTENGDLITFDFTKLHNSDSIIKICKWAVSRLISSYSVEYIHELLAAMRLYLNKYSNIKIHYVLLHLEDLAVNNNSTYYYGFKRLIIFLIEEGFPGFEPDDIYLFELLPYPKTSCKDNYYDTEVKLKPFEIAFIKKGINNDIVNLSTLSYDEILSTSILITCFEIGVRPSQLYKLHDNDFKSINDKYFSLVRPLSKGLKDSDPKPGDTLSISNEAGMFLTQLQKHRSGLGQLLRKKNGIQSRSSDFNSYIEKSLVRWGASPNVKITCYDFRHNLGHTMAMQGASAEEISFILGHTSTIVARHYISATPEIAKLKQIALGGNKFYQSMIGMIMTGEIVKEQQWTGKKVVGEVSGNLCTGIGGCSADQCKYHPVHSCYSCDNYHPFLDGHHDDVLNSLRAQVIEIMKVSDQTGQIKENPALHVLEGTIAQVKAVISRCKIEKEKLR